MPDRFHKNSFFRYIGYEPHPIQAQVHASMAPRRVLACGVRWGKTRCAAMEALAGALEPSDALHPRRGWVVAPDYGLAEKVFREIVLIAREQLSYLIRDDREHSITLSNLGGGVCEVRAKTAENPVSLLGEGLDFLIVDEAARLRPDIWDRYLSARLIDKKGWALLISTPRGKGWFYDAWRRGRIGDRKFQSWNAPSWSNPHLDRTEIEEVRARIPDAVFRQEYRAEFIEGAGSVFRNVRDCANGVLLPPWIDVMGGPDPVRVYSAGLDLAQIEDYTVLTIIDDLGRVVYFDRFHRIDWSLQIARLHPALHRYGNPPCLVDATGVGAPIYQQLLQAGLNVLPYTITNASKSALIDMLALATERREIVLPEPRLCPELVDELENFMYSITDSGNVKTGAPPGYHDDAVISCALAWWQRGTRPHFQDDPLDDWGESEYDDA